MIAMLMLIAAQQPPPRLERLDALLQRITTQVHYLAFSVAVVQGDRVAHLAGYGLDASRNPVTGATPFYIASSTKSFTALTAALLAHRGVVDLDAPIARYLPGFALPAPLDAGRVTLRRLLSHRGGFESGAVSSRTAWSGTLDRDSLVPVLMRTAGPVDTGFTYTNTQFILAARVLELVTGTTWQELIEREVLRPLGLRRTTARLEQARDWPAVTGYGPGPDGVRPVAGKTAAIMHAAGGMIMSADDAARWLRFQLGVGRLDGRQLAPRAVVAATHAIAAQQRDSMEQIRRFGYGLGWQLGEWHGDTLLHHFGNYPGAFAHVSFMPARGLGVAVFQNSEMPAHGRLANLIARYAYDLLLGDTTRLAAAERDVDSLAERTARMHRLFADDFSRRAARGRTPPRGWQPYAGAWQHPDVGTLVIATAGDSAWLEYGVIRTPVQLFQGDDIRLELVPGRTSGTVVRPTFDAEGRVTELRVGNVTLRRRERRRRRKRRGR